LDSKEWERQNDKKSVLSMGVGNKVAKSIQTKTKEGVVCKTPVVKGC